MLRHVAKTPEVRKLESPQAGRFERIVLPHLGAAFTLAMYLTRNTADAEDAVQEAVLRAVRYFPTLRDDDARAWFLTIVRRVCFTAYGTDHRGTDVISIDGIELQEFDYIDIGAVMYPSQVVPVVVKSLVFPEIHGPRAEMAADPLAAVR